MLVLVAGGLGYKMYSDHQAELKEQQAKLADAQQAARAAQAELEAHIAGIQKEMTDKLAAAKTDEERARIKAEASQKRADAAATRSSHRSSGGDKPSAPAAPTYKNVGKKAVSDNPLEGL